MKSIGYILLVIFLVGVTSFRWANPRKEISYCTIKLNDANNSKSYLTGECISYE